MHKLIQFKGFTDASLDFFNPFTLLIGPNASGKSNATKGIELLSFIARGQSLNEITDIGKGGVLEVRSGLLGFPPFNQSFF